MIAYGTPDDTIRCSATGTATAPTPSACAAASTYYLRNTLTSGPADTIISYGTDSDTILVGDWDGNGTDTIGIQRGNNVYLRNSNTGGPANTVFTYGEPGDTLVFGDWDGR